MAAIELRELTKRYGKTRAVEQLTLDILPGRVTGFLGPNGAGKSTTMRLVLGLDRATAGSATIGGRPFAAFERPIRQVGAALDPQAAHGGRTARHHLLALAVSNGLPAARVEEVLELTGIAAAGKRIKTFSLGMRQRLGIAAALLGDPEVLMLDEPTNGLDADGIVWLRKMLRDFAERGRTVLISSHLMSETALTADHLVILGRGRLLIDLPLTEFITSRGRPRVRVRTAEPARLRAALDGRGFDLEDSNHPDGDRVLIVDGARAEVVGTIAARSGISILELTDEPVSLEQAYLDLTSTETEFASGPSVVGREV